MRSVHAGTVIFLTSALALIFLSQNLLLHEDHRGLITATVAVTQDYGNTVLKEARVSLEAGGSALDLLKKIADVETAYGGGFVLSIDGLRSGYPEVKSDWFYYVNGFLAKEGASSYIVSEGDSIQWDYHTWETELTESAILGAYPQYFIRGYAGRRFETIILYEDDLFEEAESLRHDLLNTYGVSAAMAALGTGGEDQKSSANVILLARPGNRLVSELNMNHQRIGFRAWFSNSYLIESDCSGDIRRHGEAGVIQVAQNIWNSKGTMACENVVLVISGTSVRSIGNAVETLIRSPQSYRYAFGVIVSEDGVSRIPACRKE